MIVENMKIDVKELSFEYLDKKYKPLMYKFSNRYTIPGYDEDDIIQELRISMLKAQKLYSSNRNSSFMTYLYKTFDSRMKGIYRDTQGRKKDIPQKRISSLYMIVETPAIHKNELDDIEMLTGLGKEARIISEEILKGNTSNKSWLAAGLTKKEIILGKKEIIDAVTGGKKYPKFASKE